MALQHLLPDDWSVILRLCRRIMQYTTPVALRQYTVTLLDLFPADHFAEKHAGEHRHEHFEAHLILSGALTYRIGQKIYYPQAGHLLLHGPGVPHEWDVSHASMRCLVFEFTIAPACAHIRQPMSVVPDAMLRDMAALCAELDNPQDGWSDRFSLRLQLILSYLLDLIGEDSADESVELPYRMEVLHTIRYMQLHMGSHLTLDAIAEANCVPKRSLIRMFKEDTGQTITDWLTECRMKQAAHLLVSTDQSITHIAEQVGIPDVSYFGKCFRRYMETTPKRYRNAVYSLLPDEPHASQRSCKVR